jgi:hypothetical protein
MSNEILGIPQENQAHTEIPVPIETPVIADARAGIRPQVDQAMGAALGIDQAVTDLGNESMAVNDTHQESVTLEAVQEHVYRMPIKGVIPDEALEALDRELRSLQHKQ